ncbi:F-type H+-transporting ATPase subunit g, partial [Tremellales sp. Uapishka_1]
MRPQIFRTAKLAGRRFNSTTSSPLDHPQVKKAVEASQKAYQQSAETVKRVAGPLGERVGGMLGGYRDPLVYNSKVFASICRQVYKTEKLAPPVHLSQWTSAYSSIYSRAVNINWWRETVRSGAWVGVAVVAVEAYGIFKIGEILGRRNLIGYKLKE